MGREAKTVGQLLQEYREARDREKFNLLNSLVEEVSSKLKAYLKEEISRESITSFPVTVCLGKTPSWNQAFKTEDFDQDWWLRTWEVLKNYMQWEHLDISVKRWAVAEDSEEPYVITIEVNPNLEE